MYHHYIVWTVSTLCLPSRLYAGMFISANIIKWLYKQQLHIRVYKRQLFITIHRVVTLKSDIVLYTMSNMHVNYVTTEIIQ